MAVVTLNRGPVPAAHSVHNPGPALAETPPSDAHMGMAWFNGLTDAGRGYWLTAAASDRPVDAWRLFKQISREVAK